MTEPIVAIDARLIGRQGAGDTTYWLGLLHGLTQIDTGFHVLLISNAPRPLNIPWCSRFQWIAVHAKTERWWSLVTFPFKARRSGAKAIHTQYNLSPLVGRKGLTTIHDVSFFIGPEWFRPVDRVTLQQFVPSSARRARRVLTVSHTSKADIERFIPGLEGKVVVTHIAANPAIQPMERAAAEALIRKDFGLAPPYVLTVGTRQPRKNTGLAVGACERLPTEIPHRLIVSGKAGWGEEAGGKRTTALGYTTDKQLAALYTCADLYIAPSLYEGFGIPILESFACGCPVLCSDGGAQPEVAGKAAYILRGSNTSEWTLAIQQLLSEPKRLDVMRELGHKRVADFSWKDTARRTAEVYREVMG